MDSFRKDLCKLFLFTTGNDYVLRVIYGYSCIVMASYIRHPIQDVPVAASADKALKSLCYHKPRANIYTDDGHTGPLNMSFRADLQADKKK